MSNNFDLIATVDIDLSTPIVDNVSFSNLLIIGPLPKMSSGKAPPKVGAYASMKEVLAAGWKANGDDADPVGAAAQVAFDQDPTPDVIYIAPIQMLTVAEVDSEGQSGSPEKAVETVQRAIDTAGWYMLCTAGVDPSEYEEIAAFIEAHERGFCYTEMKCFPAPGEDREAGKPLCIPTVGPEYYRTIGIYGREYKDQPDEEIPAVNQYMNVAWAAKWLNYAPGSATSAFKALAGVKPSALKKVETDALVAANLNYFVTVGNRNITMNGMTLAGEWADVIRFRDWQKSDMQIRVANLFITRPKVPYTDAGISLVQNQMIASLKAGQDMGGIAEDEFDEDGHTIPGFTTNVPMAASLTPAEKASRKLRRCTFKGRLAGAIHFAELNGSLTYGL